MKESAKKNEIDPRRARTIIKGYLNPISKSEDSKELNAALMIEIAKIAKLYGARQDVEEIVLEDCIDLIKSEFSDLGIQEIPLAFRLKTLGRFKVDAEMYGGVLTSDYVGKVLTGYLTIRRKVVNSYFEVLKKNSEADQINRKRREAFDFNRELEYYKAKCQDYRAIPSYFHDSCVKRGLLSGKESKKYEKQAQTEAKKLKDHIEKTNRLTKNNMWFEVGSVDSLTETMSKQLTVWFHVFKKTQ